MKKIGQKDSSLILQHKLTTIKLSDNRVQRNKSNLNHRESQRLFKENSVREIPSLCARPIPQKSKTERLMILVESLQKDKIALEEAVKEISLERDFYKLKIDNLKKKVQTQISVTEELTKENEKLKQLSLLRSYPKNVFSTSENHRNYFSNNTNTISNSNDTNLVQESDNLVIEIHDKPLLRKDIHFSEHRLRDLRKVPLKRTSNCFFNDLV